MNINVIYHHYPHYRAPVLRELAENGQFEYRFWGSHDELNGIEPFQGDGVVQVLPLRMKKTKKGVAIGGWLPAVTDTSARALIIIGNPNFLSTWTMAIWGRLFGKKVYFWAHGWLRKDSFAKTKLRHLYFGLAHGVMVYSERSKRTGVECGYPANKIHVIYNSLDYDRSSKIYDRLQQLGENRLPLPNVAFSNPERPRLVCTARLTKICRFDLLLSACGKLRREGFPVNLLLVGDGPERENLELQAREEQVDVVFFGKCYDEDILARLIYESDLTVSPGKVGLTAIHSLSYGTPVITHGDFDKQMPEVELIEDGVTGSFFEYGSWVDLAGKIRSWLSLNLSRSSIRADCVRVVEAKWNPRSQRESIEAVLSTITGVESE